MIPVVLYTLELADTSPMDKKSRKAEDALVVNVGQIYIGGSLNILITALSQARS